MNLVQFSTIDINSIKERERERELIYFDIILELG